MSRGLGYGSVPLIYYLSPLGPRPPVGVGKWPILEWFRLLERGDLQVMFRRKPLNRSQSRSSFTKIQLKCSSVSGIFGVVTWNGRIGDRFNGSSTVRNHKLGGANTSENNSYLDTNNTVTQKIHLRVYSFTKIFLHGPS